MKETPDDDSCKPDLVSGGYDKAGSPLSQAKLTVQQGKMEQIRLALKTGCYHVSSERVATKLIKTMSEGSSRGLRLSLSRTQTRKPSGDG